LNAPALQLHEDAFFEHFQPYRHPSASTQCYGGIGLETFGNDEHLVCRQDWDFVWTVVDACDDGYQYITSGRRFVSRVVYLLSAKPHHDLPLLFRVDGRPRSLTPRGLARQVSTLSKYIAKFAPTTISSE